MKKLFLFSFTESRWILHLYSDIIASFAVFWMFFYFFIFPGMYVIINIVTYNVFLSSLNIGIVFITTELMSVSLLYQLLTVQRGFQNMLMFGNLVRKYPTQAWKSHDLKSPTFLSDVMIDHYRIIDQQEKKQENVLIARLGRWLLCIVLELIEPTAHFTEDLGALEDTEVWDGASRRGREKTTIL